MKLLIVDDEPLEREVLRMIIKQHNLGVDEFFEAQNGEDAVIIAREEKTDVAILDIKMPVMDGIMAAEMIKNDVPDCQIIFLTAYDKYDVADQSTLLQGADYLLKPAHPDDIRETLVKYIPVAHRQDPSKPDRSFTHSDIVKVMEYIEENLDKELNLGILSRLVHLNSQYLCRLFKQETGYTITQYLTIRRLEKAKQYLDHTRQTVTEISEKCGFSDSNYFARVFKRYEGITPTQYQQQAVVGRKKRLNSFNNFVM